MRIEHCQDTPFFAIGDWDPGMLDRANGLASGLPEDWRARIVLPPPPDTRRQAECSYLATLVPERAQRQQAIEDQADTSLGAKCVARLVREACSPDCGKARHKTHEAQTRLADALDVVIPYFKRMFSRGRPRCCCPPDLSPMFPPEDSRYPPHPAYPSGHSTQAHAYAFFFASIRPDRFDAVMTAAAEIARNREVAGLHYPSDSVAGKLLAGQVVDLMLVDPAFAALAKSAALEMVG